MYSILCRLIFLLFTLLHTLRPAHGILVQDHGYIYQQPQIKPFLSLLQQSVPQPPPPPPQSQAHNQLIPPPLHQAQQYTYHSQHHEPLTSHQHHFTPTPAYHFNFHQPPSPSAAALFAQHQQPTFLDNFLHADDALYYSNDGRLLKQYEVMESIIGDLQHPEEFLGASPLLLDSFLAKIASQTNNNLPGNFFDLGLKQQPSFIQPVTRNHGPVALGSGSLGYIQLPNGAAYLGSGSLGYISGQQANQAIADAKTRKGNNPPGPLHFGHGFDNN